MVCPFLSWRMNYYEIMFLGFKSYHIISECLLIWEISSDAAPVRKTKELVQRGREEGVLLHITVRVCSMLPVALPYLRPKYVICSPLCQLSRDE